MSLAELEKRKREEYEMQLFGFHSRAVYMTLKSFLQERVHQKCKQLCESIDNKYKFEGEKAELLEKIRRKLTRDYYVGINTHLPFIEDRINKLMDIPQHILLEEDAAQETQYTDEEYEAMKEKLEVLVKEVKKAKMLNGALRDELEASENIENDAEVARTLCSVVKNGSKYPEFNNKIQKLVDTCKQIDTSLDNDTDSVVDEVHNRGCLTLPPKD